MKDYANAPEDNLVISTAEGPTPRPWRQNRLLQGLTMLVALVWLVAAVEPLNRFDWLLENLLVFATVGLLGALYTSRQLSDMSYILIALFLVLHIVGSHYNYSMTPAGFWLQDALSFERNHYDRAIHFAFGALLIYPVYEILIRFAGAGRWLSRFTAFTVIGTLSVVYEVIEWIVAIVVSPEAAMAYLGTQGDEFDAQKDSALALVGAIFGLLLTRQYFRVPRAG